MWKAYMDSGSFVFPCCITFTTMIHAFVENGDLKKARKCFADMKKLGIQPDVVAYTCLMKLCLKKGLTEELESLYNQMMKEDISLDCSPFRVMAAMYKEQNIPFQGSQVWKDMQSALSPRILELLTAELRNRGEC